MQAIRAARVWHEGAFRTDTIVVVDEGRIAAVGRPPDEAGVEVQDWGDVALIPGTVNAHGHAFQNLFKGFADDRTFESWRDDVLYPFSDRLDAASIYAGALFAFAEALLAGATTTVDFFYLHDGGNDNAKQVIRAARDVGIRLVFARAFYDREAPTRAPNRYREAASDAAERCRALAAEHARDSLLSIQPAPHSLHAASPETIAAALDVAREMETPCHLHLAEAHYEPELIKKRYGATPVRLLAREGLLDDRLITIHTVCVDDEELDMLAAAGVGVVHCPGANAFLGDGIARVPEMLERGIRVALGPDGGCANNRQSVFDEMRQSSLMAKARLTNGAALGARRAFEMGTVAGADMLRVRTGAIEPGRAADLVALDLTDLSLQPLETLEYQVVNSMQPTAIARVMVGGELVVDRGRLVKFDAGEIRRRINDVAAKWERS
jgi:5-methylthioadenosine/S-adenosylhomocysteine deaminase